VTEGAKRDFVIRAACATRHKPFTLHGSEVQAGFQIICSAERAASTGWLALLAFFGQSAIDLPRDYLYHLRV